MSISRSVRNDIIERRVIDNNGDESLMAIRKRLIIIGDRIEESWLFVILKCLIEKILIIIEMEVFDKE